MRKFLALSFLIILSAVSSAQWNPNTFVNLEVASLTASDLQSVATSDGKTWIAYYAANGSGGYDMYAQLLDDAGNKLLGTNGVLVSNQPSGSATFVFNVCIDANDNLIIGFQYEISSNLVATVAKVTTAGNLPWSGGVSLGSGLSPYPAVNPEGDVIVAWNNNSPSTTYIQKLNGSTGATMYASPISVVVGTSNTTRAQLVCHSNGDYTAVFQKKGFGPSTTLYAQRYSTAGIAKWAAPIQICSGIYTASYRQYCILESNDCAYYGYYASAGTGFASYLQKIYPNGTIPWGMNGAPFSTYGINLGGPLQMTTSIAKDPNSKYVWSMCTYSDVNQNNYGVYVQKFDTATGAVALNPLGKEVYPISAARDQLCGSLTLVDDAPLFCSYEDVTYKIYGSKLDTLGNFAWPGNRVELSSTTATMALAKGRFATAGAVNGQSVMVWYEDRGSGYRVYAQNLTATAPVPVTMSELSGTNKSGAAFLTWTTLCENNNKGFEIERSRDGINFSTIGFVASKAVNGSCSLPLQYSFTDQRPGLPGSYYRLKQYDFDGRFTFSRIVYIRFDKPLPATVKSVYPVPAANELTISISAAAKTYGTIIISDMSGRVLRSRSISLEEGVNILTEGVAGLSPGAYSIRVLSKGLVLCSKSWIKD